MDTKQIIEKADLALVDLASGGALNPEQSNAFIRGLLVQPTLLKAARVVTMGSPQKNIDKIGFGSRIMRAANQGNVGSRALAAEDRARPNLGKIQLNTKEVIAEVNLPYEVIEDQIEQAGLNLGTNAPGNSGNPVSGQFKDTIMAMIAERAALDLEELALLGDTASADTYLALCDGYMKLAQDHVVDYGGATINKELFKLGIKAMPDQYLRNLAALRNYVSVNNEIEYRDSLSDRETGLGDTIIEGFRGVFGYGVPVEKVALMPASKGLLTVPNNLIMGIQRKISVEVDKDIRERVFIIVLTARVDFQIEETDAVVTYENIG